MISASPTTFESWREQARDFLRAGVRPEDVLWSDGVQSSLFGESSNLRRLDGPSPRVPASFLERAEKIASHSAPDRFGVLYRVLWKLTHGQPEVLDDPLDPDAARLEAMLRELAEEEHRMHAFIRFRRLGTTGGEERWAAWYRPAHPILERVAPFFARRYPAMRWTIFTPDRSADWDGAALTFGPGVGPEAEPPPPDELDRLFVTYYENVFNPARVNPALLRRHVPPSVATQLPEGPAMGRLVREAGPRLENLRKMAAAPRSASEAYLPRSRDVARLAEAAERCRACAIGERATQAVFGEGPRDARLVIVGEQPGDEEDVAGKPFLGPAGRLLDEMLASAGIDRSRVYVTNAVKHFKWEPRGKRRIHSRPSSQEISACHAWLMAEIEAIRPEMILCLGATAAQSFCGPGFRIGRDRGRAMETPWARWWMATYHPAAVLRGDNARVGDLLRRDLAVTYERWLRG